MGNHRRFFIDPGKINGDLVTISGDTARQIVTVLRLKEGDHICLLDGTGQEYESRIISLCKDEITAEIINKNCCLAEPKLKLTLAICLPKGDKLDLIIQKCSELGISELAVVNSERSIARLDPDRVQSKLERWTKIAAEASEQSGRGRVPEIYVLPEITELADLVESHSLALVAWENESRSSIKNILRKNLDANSIMMIIGPEGGLTEREIDQLTEAGAKPVSLGKRILRCETAAIAACAMIIYELE